MKKILLISMVFIFLSSIVNATILDCDYNNEPNIKFFNKINWLCMLNTTGSVKNYKCYSYVHFENDIIQTNPKPKNIIGIGIVDYFEPQPDNSLIQYVSAYFTTEDLRHNQAVNFSVVCSGGNETLIFEREITPRIKEPIGVFDLQVWAMENMGYLVAAIFMLILLLILVYLVLRLIK